MLSSHSISSGNSARHFRCSPTELHSSSICQAMRISNGASASNTCNDTVAPSALGLHVPALLTTRSHDALEYLAMTDQRIDSEFDAPKTCRLVHQWIGTAGLLGFSRISELSRE